MNYKINKIYKSINIYLVIYELWFNKQLLIKKMKMKYFDGHFNYSNKINICHNILSFKTINLIPDFE